MAGRRTDWRLQELCRRYDTVVAVYHQFDYDARNSMRHAVAGIIIKCVIVFRFLPEWKWKLTCHKLVGCTVLVNNVVSSVAVVDKKARHSHIQWRYDVLLSAPLRVPIDQIR